MADDSKVRTGRSENLHPHGDAERGTDARSAGDPLAELARLIGQDDLFDQMRKDAARAEMRAAQRSPAEEPERELDWLSRQRPAADELRGSYDRATENAQLSHYHEPERAYPHGDPLAQSHGRRADSYDDERYPVGPDGYGHDPRYAGAQAVYRTGHDQPAAYDQSLAGSHDGARDYESDPYAADHPQYEEAYEEPPRERRRGGLITVAAVLGLAVVGAAGAFGYRALTGSSNGAQPPVIKAEGTPAKIIPAPQNSDSQGGKLIYDRSDKPQSERVVSREEQPIEIKDAKSAGPKTVATTTISATGTPGSPSPAAMAYAPASGMPGAGASEPKKVKTFAIRPDGSPDSTGSRAPSAAPTRVAAASQQSGEATRTAPAAATRNGPLPTASITASTPAASSNYVVQLVSNKTEAEAQSAFKNLQTKYPAVLGNRTALIRRVELGDRGIYYRAQVGPFANVEQANALCDNLKAAGGQCIVQRN